MSFGEKLRKLRKEKNWTQNEISKKVGVHSVHLYRLEGDKSSPSMELIIKIAEIFDVTTDYLLRDNVQNNCNDKSGLLEKYEYLNDEHKELVERFVDALFFKDQVKKLA